MKVVVGFSIEQKLQYVLERLVYWLVTRHPFHIIACHGGNIVS